MSISELAYQPGLGQSEWVRVVPGAPRHLDSVKSSQAVALDLAPLIRAARAGDDRAFGRLVEAYRSTAERVAYHILRTEEAAADAVQDAWIKVHNAISRFEDGNFRAWLLRIVTNTCYDHLRRQKRRPAVSLDELMEGAQVEFPDEELHSDPERAVLRREQREVLMAAIGELSPWHRDVVVLVDVYGYDYGEAATLLGVPLGTVKSRLSRARSALRDLLLDANLVPTSSVQVPECT